ncbi:MAG: twin-arginine translocase TatA/TatE family subunit [Chloroflexota bacterium]|nr:twin-arginine translocase TatA/TatE family subunit [Chloroflexota bacterium]
MPDLGVPELLIIAVIVLLLFGPGKAADIGGSLGRSIKEFRKATREDEEQPGQTQASTLPPAGQDTQPAANGVARHCIECGAGVADGQKFCSNCGKPVAAAAAQ